ncbi:hypothetical protein L345_17119 [Ophiophagus hannah]|uniref:CTCK domain-containing protein n=1 Tax=Ophiophagus hannah TaxID=8665 RepID=V8N678_OPHHA|nr:hypothetical protein L345_17119 [Ophiophagus hannah]
MMLDECTTCQCNARQGLYLTYKLMCGKITCEPCPKNYQMEKTSGSCCGKCLPTRCNIQLRDGTILYLKGKVTKVGNTCCETCVEPECKLTIGRLEFVKVDNCVNENQLNLHYCEGKCTSKAIYNITLNRLEDICTCCSATATNAMLVPLRCANGSLVHHQVFNARECECLSRQCQP